MARTLTIGIKPLTTAFADFRATMEKARTSPRAALRLRAQRGVYFTSLEAARRLLTPARLDLLRVVRAEPPASVLALARRLGRDLRNVQGDLAILERYGLVRMKPGRTPAGRHARVPHAPFSVLALKIVL